MLGFVYIFLRAMIMWWVRVGCCGSMGELFDSSPGEFGDEVIS